jgi:hypothetical protein
MVVTRRNHELDTFDEFLFNSKDVLNSDARAVSYRANNSFGLQLTSSWFYNVDITCPEDFIIINMGMGRVEFWMTVITKPEEGKRAVRLIGIQAAIKEIDAAGILFHDMDIGLDKREIYLIEY